MLEEEKIELSDKVKEFLELIEAIKPARFLGCLLVWTGLGRPMIDRENIIRAFLTSAFLHDSQVAIPMMQMTSQRVTYLYDLMDAAYDAKKIKEVSQGLGHVPIIDPNPRRGEAVPLEPAREQRYNERSAVERINSNLKDNYDRFWQVQEVNGRSSGNRTRALLVPNQSRCQTALCSVQEI